MKPVLCNAFSLNMLPRQEQDIRGEPHKLSIWEPCIKLLTLEEARDLLLADGFISAIGHADTARVLSGILDKEVPVNRHDVTLAWDGSPLVVAQYSGPRLPEGATTLPEGARIDWFRITRGLAY